MVNYLLLTAYQTKKDYESNNSTFVILFVCSQQQSLSQFLTKASHCFFDFYTIGIHRKISSHKENAVACFDFLNEILFQRVLNVINKLLHHFAHLL